MNIVRAPRPDSGYTILRNDLLRDDRLSYRSRGILTYILSHTDNWRTDVETLATHGREGKQALYTAMKELEAAGYLIRKRVRNEANGTFAWSVTVYDVPQDGAPTVTQETPRPAAVKNDTDKATKQASRIVADVWEPATAGTNPQPNVAVVRIVAGALRNGIAPTAIAKALVTIAKNKQTVTINRLNEAINGKPVRGQLAADAPKNWSELAPNGEMTI